MAKYRERAADVDACRVTEETFGAPHPNPEHIKGVVYDPVRRCARVDGMRDAKIGDWLVRSEGSEKVVVMTDSIFNAIFAPVVPTAPTAPTVDMNDEQMVATDKAFEDARAVALDKRAEGGRVGFFIFLCEDNERFSTSWMGGNIATVANAFRALCNQADRMATEDPLTCPGCINLNEAMQLGLEAFESVAGEARDHTAEGHVH